MSAYITLADVAWALPDGRHIFQNLNLQFGRERVGLVGRNGIGKSTLLKLISGDLEQQSGSLDVAGRIGILRQNVQPREGETVADLFGIRADLELLDCAERGVATLEQLADIDWTLPSRLETALDSVGLDTKPDVALETLSGGQRTRAAIAALVFARPDFLLLDEPTNNLDRDGRVAVIELLASWRSGAIVVSHDRELLEMMDVIVELTSLGATRYGGNWSHYRQRKAIDLAAANHDLAEAEKQAALLKQVAQERAERQDRHDKGGRRTAARGDMPKILAGSRKNRADATGGRAARLADRREADAAHNVEQARNRLELLQPLSVTIPSTNLPAGKVVLGLDNIDAGYIPNRPVLSDFSLQIVGPERVAITGANGSGKTTLLSLVAGSMTPWQGHRLVTARFALLDQSVSLLDPQQSVRDNFRRINPDANENACRAALARFMFRGDAALQIAGSLSGGQLLRAGLACVLGGPVAPSLLVLDEPTNHLDIDAIEVVEAGLRAFDGALLVVSHDETFWPT